LKIKLYILIFPILFIISCINDKNEIDFPTSNVNNFDLENNNADYLVNVIRLKNGEYQIEYRDTLISKLDSTLHGRILDLKKNNRRIHEHATIKLQLGKDILYSEFKKLTDEFRKVFYQKFVLSTSNDKYLRIQLLPYYQVEDEYIDGRIKGLGPPHTLYEELKPYFTENKVLYVTIDNGILRLIDNKNNKITDYKKFALNKKSFITLYKIESDQTYQDFVNLYSQLVKWRNELKILIEEENKDTKQTDEYQFMIAEKTDYSSL